MAFRFNIGTHRARPLYWLHWFFWLIRPKAIRRNVIFSQESKYDLQSEDQQDWNKLFGISFSINSHKQSARFGVVVQVVWERACLALRTSATSILVLSRW